jgi:hypothetical protein
MIFGLINTRMMEPSKPVKIPDTAPTVLKRFQKRLNRITGRLALAATAKARATKRQHFDSYIRELE